MNPLYSKWREIQPQNFLFNEETSSIFLSKIINYQNAKVFYCEIFVMRKILNEGLAPFRIEIPNLELLSVQKSVNP